MATKAQLEKELKKTQTMLNAALDKLKNKSEEKVNEVVFNHVPIDTCQELPRQITLESLFNQTQSLSVILEGEINTIFNKLSSITGQTYLSKRDEFKEVNCYIDATQQVLGRLDEQVSDIIKIRSALELITN